MHVLTRIMNENESVRERAYSLILKVTEEEILNLLHSILKNPITSPLTKRYVLTALVKLSTRFSVASQEYVSILKTCL
jgi:hypothetical protein